MEQGITPQQALTQAVNRIGSQSAMARLLGISQAAVWKWITDEMVLPAEHVFAVERATHVSRHDLRPDLYPRGLQDDVPFIPSEGIAAIGELAGAAAPEWPIGEPEGRSAENSGAGFQPQRPAE